MFILYHNRPAQVVVESEFFFAPARRRKPARAACGGAAKAAHARGEGLFDVSFEINL
jgi:hypothetical protein